MKYYLKYLLWVLSLLLIQSCEYIEGLHHEGIVIEKEEQIGAFNKIRIETSVNLILEQNEEGIVRISGLDFKVENIIITIENEELVIHAVSVALARKDQMTTIFLPVKALEKISVNAPSEISSEGELILDNFMMVINGRGTYTNSNLKLNCKKVSIAAYGENLGTHSLTGATESLHLTMEGLANADASQMIAKEAAINQRSLKSSYLQVLNKLHVNMYSSGHVYYKGSPSLVYKTRDPGWNVVYGKAINQSK